MGKYICCLVIIFCLALACKEREYVPTGEISAPTMAQRDSADHADKVEDGIVIATTPPELIKIADEAKKKGEESSPFRREGCCDSQDPPALCCCDAILSAYKKMLKDSDIEYTAKIRATDPFFNKCFKMIPDFKTKIDMIEMSE